VAERVDLAAVAALAASAGARDAGGEVPLPPTGPPVRVAVAGGPAFTFTYTDTVDALAAGGAEVVTFDPLRDSALPERIDGLVVGGGFPETFAAELSANRPLLDDAARRVGAGVATWAECGGLLWLARTRRPPDGRRGAASGRMTERLTLGYRTATTAVATPVGPVGTTFTGHEFHYGRSTAGRGAGAGEPFGRGPEVRFAHAATYVHHHPGGDPGAVAAFPRPGRARQSAV
jgi:cobyrinic acid a,c-diamide synthase